MKKILLLLAVTAVTVMLVATTALADQHVGQQSLPDTGGPALLPIVGVLAASLGLSALAYLRRRR